ncbi:MAG: ROK family transcriptional regulator [Ruminococcus sp.]|nr:ROK family transcriptional regulator [Ruminococcus sp.]
MNNCGISKLDLKRRNRMQILRVIKENNSISRADIARKLKITRAAVTVITTEMLEKNILKEAGSESIESGYEHKGRRKVLLSINPVYSFSIGVYIDKDVMYIGLTTLNFDVLDKRKILISESDTLDTISEIIGKTAKKLLQNNCLNEKNIVGIGIGVMPIQYERLEVEKEEDEFCFARFDKEIKKHLNCPIYINNAISLIAMSNISYNKKTFNDDKLSDFVFLSNEDRYDFVIIKENNILSYSYTYTNIINKMCVNPNGKSCTGYPNGSVQAELSVKALSESVAPIYSEESTPALYLLTKGDINTITISKLLTALDEGDTKLKTITEHIMEMFCMLLNNLIHGYVVERIYLHHFDFTNRHITVLKQYMKRFIGEIEAEKIYLSSIEENHQFIGGCIYAVEKGFYQKGGF